MTNKYKTSTETWTAEDEKQAAAEGWALIDALNPTRPAHKYDIIALAGLDSVFSSDASATDYVRSTHSSLHNKVRRLNGHTEVDLREVQASNVSPPDASLDEAEALYKALQNNAVLNQLKAAMQAVQDATYSSVYHLVSDTSFKQMDTEAASDLLLETLEYRMLLVSEACEGLRGTHASGSQQTTAKAIANDSIISAISSLLVLASVNDINLGEGFVARLQSNCELYADSKAPSPSSTTKRIPTPTIK